MAAVGTGSLPSSGIPLLDALTNGSYWALASDRTITWALADLGTNLTWTNPSATAAVISDVLDSFEEVANIHFSYKGHFGDPTFTSANIFYTGTYSRETFGIPGALAWAQSLSNSLTRSRQAASLQIVRRHTRSRLQRSSHIQHHYRKSLL
jgi:hypothetical protein